MPLDDTLFTGRILFLLLVAAFVVLLVWLSWREMRSAPFPPDDAAPGCLQVVQPGAASLAKGTCCGPCPMLVVTSVGRGRANDVILDDPSVATDHAVFTWNLHGWSIKNRSAQGTFVDGKKIRRTSVSYGDIIQFGNVSLRLIAVPKDSREGS